MWLADFIRQDLDTLVADWEAFADDITSDGSDLDRDALRNFSRELLTCIADDIAVQQSSPDRMQTPGSSAPDHSITLTRSARVHAIQRFVRSFSQDQLLAEFRAMRANVIRRWRNQLDPEEPFLRGVDDLIRFNDAVDQLVEESLATFGARREEEQSRQEDILRRRSERLRELDRQKDLFLATLGHELRNPLAGIDLGIRALKEGSGDRDRLQELIEHELHRLTVLTDDLLDASRIARDKIELELTEVDMTTLVHSTAELFQGQIAEKEQDFRLAVPDEAITLTGDETRLRQVVENLLSNAIRYTGPGGVIAVTLAAEDHGAVLTVADDGQGIPAEEVEEIFEPFTQRDPDAGGLGLGLPIARRLTELHGGRLEVESNGLGQGSVFRAHLPAISATGQTPSRGLLERERLPRTLRVVVVDDEAEFGENLALYLRVRGCRATAVTSGTELLERLEQLAPHVVLMDLGLPTFSGYQAAEALGRRVEDHNIMLVAISGYGDPQTAERVRAAGFHEQMLKPLDLDRLHELLLSRVEQGL